MKGGPTIPRYLFSLELAQLPQYTFDYLVIGAGIAGLFSALSFSPSQKVLVVSKQKLEDGNTYHAQGGIAAVLDEDDSADLHFADTLEAGAGLCEPEPVRALVEEGPELVKELLAYGVPFDKEDGSIALTKEGAHSRRRIWHANGDATGRAILKTLLQRAQERSNLTLWPGMFLVDLITHPQGEGGKLKISFSRGITPQPSSRRCLGGVFLNAEGELAVVWARAVILATGGAGQLYEYTTNPESATGTGLAAALRAGASLADLEFFQFHPTALYLPPAPRFLISEAVRGEGAVLRNLHGERFMAKYHELAELAPRDVVSKVIMREMKATGTSCVYLDLSALSAELIKERFPTIYHRCLRWGLDITVEMIPVAPAAHYLMGGVATDLHGRTGVGGLYAAGEAACTGVHGANRLASNSLLEGIVFGRRAALSAQRESITSEELAELRGSCQEIQGAHNITTTGLQLEIEKQLQKTMTCYVGMEREASLLAKASEILSSLLAEKRAHPSITHRWVEDEDMLTAAMALTSAAAHRRESRGAHERLDFPERDDVKWQGHIIISLDR
jgi:L-aspartate oxidase